MPIATDDIIVAEVVLKQQFTDAELGVQECRNIFHYRRRNFPAAPVKSQLATAIDAAWVQTLLEAQHECMSLTELGIRWQNDPEDATTWFTSSPLAAGQTLIATSDAMPANAALSMYLQTGYRGPRNRGYKRFAGLAELHTTRAYLNDAGLALWDPVRDALTTLAVESPSGNEWSIAVWNRFDSDVDLIPQELIVNDVSIIKINRAIRSQDSRKHPSVFA